MFIIRPSGTIRRAKRPADWDKLEYWDGCHFVPENRAWDANETELIVKAIGTRRHFPQCSTFFGLPLAETPNTRVLPNRPSRPQ